MIERISKILKGEYPKLLEAKNHRHLKQLMADFILDYMDRPHGTHILYTPREVLTQQDHWLDYQTIIRDNSLSRIKKNRSCTCNVCDC